MSESKKPTRRQRKAEAARVAKFAKMRETLHNPLGVATPPVSPGQVGRPGPVTPAPARPQPGGLTARSGSGPGAQAGGPGAARSPQGPASTAPTGAAQGLSARATVTTVASPWGRRDTLSLAGFGLVITVTVMAALGRGGPLFHPGWDLWKLGATMLPVIPVAYLLRRFLQSRTAPSPWVVLKVVAAFGFLLAAFVHGASTSVIVDGKIYGTWTATAEAHRLLDEMRDDLETLVEVDDLLAANTSEGRARIREFDPTRRELEAMSKRWATTELADLPSGDFAPLVTSLDVASRSALEALDRREALLSQEDARLSAELDSFRNSFVEAVLGAAPQLEAVAATFGFELPVLDETTGE